MNKSHKHTFIGDSNRTKPPIGVAEQLLTGHAFFHKELTPDELRPYWKRYSKFIMALIGVSVREVLPKFFPCGPDGVPIPWGHRPWAWWQFESQEPRRLLSGDPSLADPSRGLWFGVPKFYKSAAAHASLTYESEPAYLERLGLLLPGEDFKICDLKDLS